MTTRRYAEDHSDDSDYARHMRRPQRGQSPERDRDRDREYRRPSQRRYNGQEESDSDEEEYRRPTRRKPPPGDRDSEIRNSRGGSVRNSGERAASSFTPKALSSTTSTPSAAWVDSRKDNWVEKENSRPVPTQSWTSASRSMERDRGDDRGLTRDRRGSGRESDRDYEIDREHVRRSRDGGYRSRRDQYSDDESPYTDSTSPDMLTLPPRGQREPGGRGSTSRSKGSDSGDRGGDAVEEYQERDRRRGGSRGHDGGDVGRRRENSRSRERHNDRLFEDGGRFTREDNMTKSRDRSHSKGGDDWRDDGNEDQSLVGSRRESFGDRSKNSDYREEVYKHALTTYGSQSAMTTADPIERRGSATSMTSTPNTADEDESQESERGRDFIKDTTSYSASSATKGGAAFIMYSPASGGSTDLVQCLIVRERTGMGSSMYPSYKLFLEDKNKLLLIGRKMNFNSTSNYHIFDMTRGTASKKLTKKSGNYLGKLRAADSNRTEYALVTRSEVREEVAAIVFDRVGLVSQIKDGCQPRKMSVLLPQLDAESHPVPHRTENKHGVKKSMVDMLKRDDTSRMFLLASKEPVYENGNYRLNFHGRVSVPSVKNFQLSSPDDPGHVICQFGKIGDDRFHLDYKAPLNAFQAFSLALCHFDA